MPVILTAKEELEIWLRAPWPKASTLQRPLPHESLQIVMRFEKQDGGMSLANLAARASTPHTSLPLLEDTSEQ